MALRRGPLLGLMLGSLAIISNALAVAALGPVLAHGFGIGLEHTGAFVAAYGLVYALAAPTLGGLTAAAPRPLVLAAGLILFGIGCLACVLVVSNNGAVFGTTQVPASAGAPWTERRTVPFQMARRKTRSPRASMAAGSRPGIMSSATML